MDPRSLLLAASVATIPTRSKALDAPRALYEQAIQADLGTTGQPDAARAFALYQQAAILGVPEAQLNVAVMYDSGRGIPRDAAQAATWYAEAAIGGIPRAAFDLGQLYQAGDGVPRNPGLARAWFLEAAQQGIAAAAVRAGQVAQGEAQPIQPPAMRYPLPGSTLPPSSNGLALVWTAAPTPAPAEFFVQVLDLASTAPQAPYTITTPLSAARMPPPRPGRYAWRVFTLCPSLGRYIPSGWTAFSIS